MMMMVVVVVVQKDSGLGEGNSVGVQSGAFGGLRVTMLGRVGLWRCASREVF